MQIGNGLKLLFMTLVGVVLILAGVRGNLGSVLAALFVPDSMQNGQLPPPCNSVEGHGGPLVGSTLAQAGNVFKNP